jgi:carbonic anhydrase/acetyltransferase-like protein (isoleucine patch superfamily)
VALLIPFRGHAPRIAPDAFVAPTAVLIGDVTVEAEASIWFGAVLRGDDPAHGIVVGRGSSVQEGCVVHVGRWGPTVIGPECTIGHGAKFESCSIGERTIVGMNAVILQEARIGRECVVAAGAVVTEGARVPDRSLVAGVPARVKKTLEGSAAAWVEGGGRHYVELSREYLAAGVGRPAPAGDGARCELCGGPVLQRHCKIVCLNCGYQRDCSDP